MKKATSNIRYYKNSNGPIIGTTLRPVIKQDGLYFKDLNGDGKLNAYKDWRNTPLKRAEALAAELSVDEKIGLLFINSWKMGIYQEDKSKVDETGLLNEEIVEKDESIFNCEKAYGTTYTVKNMGIRHMILRQNPSAAELTDWINQLNQLAEQTEHSIPVMVLSNSRNENGEIVFGMNDAAGVFATWPGTMGIAAAVKGSDVSLIDNFAECIRQEWNSVGMRKGYMYMADVMSDPRWQRTYGTFGEDPVLICEIIQHLIQGIQGSSDGVTPDGVALTIKHFPGGGARENGFDPHYVQGQWNVYSTEDSLKTYHLPAFQVAIDQKVSSIMPYYAKPAAEKSQTQYDFNQQPIPMKQRGFAFNSFFLQDLLRTQMGFTGYINSDSGITNKMAWGVEDLDIPSRIALAINSGVDIISGSMDVFSAKEAYERGKNGYYTTQGNPVPEGYTIEQLVLTDETLTRAVTRTLEEKFALGMFDNPYRDPQVAEQVVATQKHWDDAYDVHLKSVVPLKNHGNLLPLNPKDMVTKKVYVECFRSKADTAETETRAMRENLQTRGEFKLADCYEEADLAILFVSPSSGEYFNATKGYLELDICEGKLVADVGDEGAPLSSTHPETTLANVGKIEEISKSLHTNGGKVIVAVNFTLAWMLGNVEPYADALLAGFDTYPDAILDIITGKVAPSGRMPITLPKNDAVIAVNDEGNCISRNDVPGYDKDLYMPEYMKDENGKAYAYRDEDGNYYELGFGLRWKI